MMASVATTARSCQANSDPAYFDSATFTATFTGPAIQGFGRSSPAAIAALQPVKRARRRDGGLILILLPFIPMYGQ